MSDLQHFSTLPAYCQGIGIPAPKQDDFDTRCFEENMKTVRQRMPPFKHEFYAVALKLEGSGYASTGNYNTKDLKATVFFNSPYQILHWDIAPDWKGFYIMFSEDFYRRFHPPKRITEQFPFLLNDNTLPLEVTEQEAKHFFNTFQDIYTEYHQSLAHREEIIFYHTSILLRKVARLYYRHPAAQNHSQVERDNDLDIVSRFKTLLETAFYPNQSPLEANLHQVQFYAEQMHMHPNHLNAVIKRITDISASKHIQNHLLSLAKAKLKNTNQSIKEIAYGLRFNYPNHFSSFFKKLMGMSPAAYRQS